MTIAPVVRTVEVKCGPARAFELFSARMGSWWPVTHHVGGAPFEEVVIEAKTGGRWFERDAAGVEAEWGKVLEFAPPGRLLLAWQLDAGFKFDPDLVTELEITFEDLKPGTRVRLEHRNLERFGDRAQEIAETLRGGWPTIVDGFAVFADQTQTQGA